MKDIWLWQQYFTAGLAIFGVVIQAMIGLVSANKAGQAILTILLIAFGQWVLLSGGWY